jgi:photosystem II stability/assembly factor-like uncharacterized protein
MIGKLKQTKWLLTGIFAFSAFALSAQTVITDATFSAMEGRPIGPARTSGRIAAIDAVNSDPNIIYVGAAGGGVWKSKNQGTTFKPIFDDYSQSIGAICIDQQHPDTVWVGTGEPWTRNSVSVGTGIYRTVNGGEKFELMGLANSERIAKIIIDPSNSNTVYVAVQGALWSNSEERGVYKTTDGGKTWNKVLYVNPSTGCASLAMDPNNSNVLYAAMWDHQRSAYDFRSGGPGSALFKSVDGGTTWIKLINGLPNETLGRIAVAVSPVAPYAVYALVESKKSALYKSTDNGANWLKMSQQTAMGERPFYFSQINPDPIEADRIYKPGFSLLVSTDGGKVFQGASTEGGAYHSDLHAFYVSPKDNRLMYLGTDGGVYISRDKGNTWSHCENLPVAQFYHVSVDMQTPYNIYGGLQDNGSWMAPSSNPGGIQNSDWKTIGIGDGFNAYADKTDNDILYWQYQGGRIYRTNTKTGENKFIKPFPDGSTEDLRYNWNTPVVFGKKTGWLYVGSQYLYRSKDKGDSWERISPDLTSDDPKRQQQEKSGGITADNTTAENNTTIFCISESPLDENIIWVGTDDGNVQVTTDGGKTWTKLNANITGAPAFAFVSGIESDNFDKGAAYVTFDAHRNGDMKSYVFYTNDYGKTWKSIVNETVKGYCHVIKQDLVNRNLLFLGTEFGLFLSIDKGATWVAFKSNVPQVGVFDMVIHPRDHDLILATHGRGIIIIDDITILRNFSLDVLEQDIAFLPTRPYYLPLGGMVQDFPGDDEFVGSNPNGSAVIAYYLKKRHMVGDMFIEIYDSKGNFIKQQPAGMRKGVNIVRIQTMLPPPRVPSSPNVLAEAAFGPEMEPGTYVIKLVKGKDTVSTSLTINYNPETKHSAADRQLRRETLLKAYNLLEELAYVDFQAIEIRNQTTLLADSVKNKGLRANSFKYANQMSAMHEKISATQPGEGGITGQVRLREKIAEIYMAVSGYEGKPTDVQIKALELYASQVLALQIEINTLLNGDLVNYNAGVVRSGLQAVKVTDRETFMRMK